MRRVTSGWAFALAVAGGLAAQQPVDAPAAGVDYAALVAEYDSAQQAFAAARKQITDSDEFAAARKAGDQAKTAELLQRVQFDAASYVARFQAGADAVAGTPAAVPFLVWILSHTGDAESLRKNFATLVAAHLDDARLLPLAETPGWAMRAASIDEGLGMLQQLAEGSTHDLVKAHAYYALSTGTSRSKRGDAEAMARAEAWLRDAERLAAGSELELRIQAPRFAKERLQIGMAVPDIEGEDLDGVAFKLSDYRGKVVVLDFWGDW